MHHASANPRIVRLTPLADALPRLLALAAPVAPSERAAADGCGAVLAEDVRAHADLPPTPVAYTDGWAVNAEELVGATAYSATILAPPPAWVEADDPMPDATDAVLPPEAITIAAPGMAEAGASIAPGDGVRNTGSDIAEGDLLLPSGTRLAAHHVGLLGACGIARMAVRVPRVRLVIASSAAERHTDLARLWIEAAGAAAVETVRAPADRAGLAGAYAAGGPDFVISLGGTGQGRTDMAVAALGDCGTVDLHGVAVRPGSGAAFGRVGDVPVLLLPGRLDALIAAWQVMARPVLERLAGAAFLPPPFSATVSDKVVSTIGMAEVFLALPDGGRVRPAPLEEASFDALARAIGWFAVTPESEGLAAGQTVQVRAFSPR